MIHAATIFLSSFLLFLVQPLIARQILPWFGGTAAVWTTCMLFFQSLLLAGYAYAHGTNAKLSPRRQAQLHTVLLVLALATLPIAPADAWKPLGTAEPITAILLVLAATVGLPYLLLASTSPLLQAWFARAHPGENPYRLFAVSNLASLLALAGYPLLVEPFFGNREQVVWWSILFGVFAVFCAGLSWSISGKKEKEEVKEQENTPPPGRRDYLLWLALSATGSVLLLAVTNHVTQNVAAIPLLWLAPLTLYLLTFIIAFEGGGLYRVEIFWTLVLVWLAGMSWLLVDARFQFDLWMQLGMFLSGLFVGCMFCHGELYRARPAVRHLTAFYLTISAGGALGGLLVAVVAPLVFNAFYELGIALLALAVLAAVRFAPLNPYARWTSLAMLLAVAACAAYDGARSLKDVVLSERNFYGAIRIKQYGEPGTSFYLRRLVHGVIMHGEQYLEGERRRRATTYYLPTSGVGLAIAAAQARGPVKIGVIGLGAGTLAAYGRKGDDFRFYEINPQVVDVARRMFYYLSDTEAGVEVALGDARLNLEREIARGNAQGFDILAVDAFSSDAIPVHLITREALELYLRHMKPLGVIAFHVSNRFLNLPPVVGRLARERGLQVVLVSDEGKEDEDDHTKTDWVLIARDPAALKAKEIAAVSPEPPEEHEGWRTWTDDYSNLVQILK